MINFHMKMQVICNESNKFQSIHLRAAERQVCREQEKEMEDSKRMRDREEFFREEYK